MNVRRRIRSLQKLLHLDRKIVEAVRQREPDSSFFIKDVMYSSARSPMSMHQPSVHVILSGREINVPIEPAAYQKWFNNANQCFKTSARLKLRVWTLRAPIQDDCWTHTDNKLYYSLANQMWEVQVVSFDELPAE